MLRIEKCRWSPAAAAGLAETIDGDEAALSDQVGDGRAELWYFPDYDGWLITRVECYEDGSRALCMVAARKTNRYLDIGEIIGAFEKAAKAQGLNEIYITSERRGYERFIRRYGFALAWRDGQHAGFRRGVQ